MRPDSAGLGVYNLGMTRDGRLIATIAAISPSPFSMWSPARSHTRVRTRRKVVHGVAVAPDDRYAFISVEGIASEPGTVEVSTSSR